MELLSTSEFKHQRRNELMTPSHLSLSALKSIMFNYHNKSRKCVNLIKI